MKTKLTERKGAKGLIIALLLAVIMIAGTVVPKEVIAGSTGFPWTHGDWSSRVRWEARKALSENASGTSSWPVSNSSYWLGDWDYVASDGYAYQRAILEASDVGPVTDIDNHHRGGWCTFFVRLVLYRATYWAGYGEHLTTPAYPDGLYAHVNGDYMTDRYDTVQPGWIFITTITPHYAIADQRANVNGQWGWWLIDSNFVESTPTYRYYIGKHFMSDATLRANSYRAWRPDRATAN